MIQAPLSAAPSAFQVMHKTRAAQGFTLVELMLATLVGCLLCGVVCGLLFSETRQGGAFAESLQLKQLQRRTFLLLKLDLERASSWQIAPDPSADGAGPRL